MNCDKCKFWEKMSADQGGCRRYPPQVTIATRMLNGELAKEYDSTFPQTGADDWCGEYKLKPAPSYERPLPPRAPAPTKEW